AGLKEEAISLKSRFRLSGGRVAGDWRSSVMNSCIGETTPFPVGARAPSGHSPPDLPFDAGAAGAAPARASVTKADRSDERPARFFRGLSAREHRLRPGAPATQVLDLGAHVTLVAFEGVVGGAAPLVREALAVDDEPDQRGLVTGDVNGISRRAHADAV